MHLVFQNKHHKPDHDESVLNFLNSGNLNDGNEWVAYEKGQDAMSGM